jgi:hypothetical protein
MRLAEQLSSYTILVEYWLKDHAKVTRHDVKTGRDAWAVAHRAGIVTAAYDVGRDVVDAHIQTALQRIFPNAVFKDAKRY